MPTTETAVMTFENYQTWIWAIYALSALVVMLVTLRMTRNWHSGVKGFLRVTVLVLMAMPWYVQQDATGPLAPAITVAVFEGVTLGGDGWKRAGLPLIAVLSLGYLLWLAGWWVSRRLSVEKEDKQREPHNADREKVEPSMDGAEKVI